MKTQTLDLSSIDALILDMRGTLIDPFKDESIHDSILERLVYLLGKNIKISIITAGSLDTVYNLILKKLFQYSNRLKSNYFRNLIIYTDSSTKAFTITTDMSIKPLENFPIKMFRKNEVYDLSNLINFTNKKFNLKNFRIKIKDGQINYYCGGTFRKRVDIANYLKRLIVTKKLRKFVLSIPSSKRTIDISVCGKSRGVVDFINRFKINKERILLVSDSLQKNGSDTEMLKIIGNGISIHVGKNKNIESSYKTILNFTDGTQTVLNSIFTERTVI